MEKLINKLLRAVKKDTKDNPVASWIHGRAIKKDGKIITGSQHILYVLDDPTDATLTVPAIEDDRIFGIVQNAEKIKRDAQVEINVNEIYKYLQVFAKRTCKALITVTEEEFRIVAIEHTDVFDAEALQSFTLKEKFELEEPLVFVVNPRLLHDALIPAKHLKLKTATLRFAREHVLPMAIKADGYVSYVATQKSHLIEQELEKLKKRP